MFGFMLDETEIRDNPRANASCQVCHLHLAPRAPQVVADEAAYHRECYEAAQVKRTGRRPRLVRVTVVGDTGHTFRPAA